MGLFQELNDTGITLVMVTHELDIAATQTHRRHARRQVISDTQNENRRVARQEIATLNDAERKPNSTDLLLLQTLFLRSWQTAFIAVRALRRNKMRSSSRPGIIIGVASVIAMVAVGNGAQPASPNKFPRSVKIC